MADLRICFEVSTTENGVPCTFGMRISLGETNKAFDYNELAKSVNVDALISVACLDSLGVTKDDIRIITPEEYDELYGEG